MRVEPSPALQVRALKLNAGPSKLTAFLSAVGQSCWRPVRRQASMRGWDALDLDFARGRALQLLGHAVMHRQAELDATCPTTHDRHLACHTVHSADTLSKTSLFRHKPRD